MRPHRGPGRQLQAEIADALFLHSGKALPFSPAAPPRHDHYFDGRRLGPAKVLPGAHRQPFL
ncbi:hypothetical protein D3C86_2262170 [compost metagenome]